MDRFSAVGQKSLRFHSKYLHLCLDEQISFGFRMTKKVYLKKKLGGELTLEEDNTNENKIKRK